MSTELRVWEPVSFSGRRRTLTFKVVLEDAVGVRAQVWPGAGT